MSDRQLPSVEASDSLIADLYRAAAAEVPWGVPLSRLRVLFEAWGVHLHGVEVATGRVAFSYEVGGFPPDGVLAYIREYHRLDPRAALVARLGLGEWVSCHQHFDDDFVAGDRFYQDFLIPYGGRYVSGAKVHEDSQVVAILGIHRGRGTRPLDDDELGLCRRLGRHVCTALALWRRQVSVLAQCQLGNTVLDQLPHPVLLIDEQLQLHHANLAAHRLLQGHEHLRLREGALAIASPDGQHELLLALRRLRIGGAASYRDDGPAQTTRTVVRLGNPHGSQALALVISRLNPELTMGAFGPRDLAMILVHELHQRAPIDRFLAAAIYGLTPAEAAVAVEVAQGCMPADIATDHCVALSTVRAQLSSVFSKMGISRQAELVAALATLPPADRQG